METTPDTVSKEKPLLDEPIPAISIVVVNSDGETDTLRCLQSLHDAFPSIPFEIVLVDNCSSQPIFPNGKQLYPNVKQVMAPERQGFSKNYNLGIRHARGQYVMILNNDTKVRPGAVDALVHFQEANPSFGIVGPLLISGNGVSQPVCARKLMSFWDFILEQVVFDLGMPLGKFRNWLQRLKLEHRKSGPVPCISGACMLSRRDVLDKVGLLDEAYQFYFEDVEWCRRMQDFGYQVGFVRESVITHLGDRSLSKVRFWAKQSEYFGALQYFCQYDHLSKAGEWAIWLATLVGYLLRWCAFSLFGKLSKSENYASVYRRLAGWLIGRPPKNSRKQ